MQSLLGFLSAILSFFDLKEFASHLLMGVALTGSPIITALRKLVKKKIETLPTLVLAPLH